MLAPIVDVVSSSEFRFLLVGESYANILGMRRSEAIPLVYPVMPVFDGFAGLFIRVDGS